MPVSKNKCRFFKTGNDKCRFSKTGNETGTWLPVLQNRQFRFVVISLTSSVLCIDCVVATDTTMAKYHLCRQRIFNMSNLYLQPLNSWTLGSLFGIHQGVFKSSEQNEPKSLGLSRLSYSTITVCYDMDRSSNHENLDAKLDDRPQPKHFSHGIAYFVSYGRWKSGAVVWDSADCFSWWGTKQSVIKDPIFITTYVAPTMHMIAGLFESSNPGL